MSPSTNEGTAMGDENDPVAAVHRYIDAFNKGDADAMAAAFAPHSSILDGMAPHLWVGPKASQDWYRDVLAEGKRHGASEYRVTLRRSLATPPLPRAAYVVVPATMTFNLQGKQVTQTGAVFTVALTKLAEGWRIAAWAWRKARCGKCGALNGSREHARKCVRGRDRAPDIVAQRGGVSASLDDASSLLRSPRMGNAATLLSSMTSSTSC